MAQNTSQDIINRLKGVDSLPHFPAALMKLEKILSSETTPNNDEIVDLISQDPRMVAGMINVVNSARYSPGYQVTDLNEAVNRIGLKEVRSMAHAINYQETVAHKLPFSKKDFIKHSLMSAFVAQEIAKQVLFNQSEAFLCGLLHDIGMVLLAVEDHEGYKQVMTDSYGQMDLLLKSEFNVFGTTHATMSARMLQHWRFSKDIIMGVAGHHTPHKAKAEFQNYAYLTYLAEQGAYLLEKPNGIIDEAEDIEADAMQDALDCLGLSIEQFEEVMGRALIQAEASGFL